VRLTVIGCSGSFPGPDSPASCYLVEADGFRVVVDLGNGALGPLQRHCAIGDIGAVLLSHLHPDHVMDVLSLYVARSYDPVRTYPVLPVHGPSGAATHLSAAYGSAGPAGLGAVFDFRTWTGGSARVGPFTVSVARVAHPVEAWGMRLEHAGRVLTYSADTGPTDALVDLARDADVFLCEASFQHGGDNPPDLHLTGREAGEHATRAGARRLLLTHVPPWYDAGQAVAEAATTFTGPLELATPGAAYDV
jgi:ribonuclease BN (tRNA processing enzyme)